MVVQCQIIKPYLNIHILIISNIIVIESNWCVCAVIYFIDFN